MNEEDFGVMTEVVFPDAGGLAVCLLGMWHSPLGWITPGIRKSSPGQASMRQCGESVVLIFY